MVVIAHLSWIFAHQGGWDELAMFGIPIVLAVVGVRWADRRAKAKAGRKSQGDAATGESPHGDSDPA